MQKASLMVVHKGQSDFKSESALKELGILKQLSAKELSDHNHKNLILMC
jgi:hypothetical protein